MPFFPPGFPKGTVKPYCKALMIIAPKIVREVFIGWAIPSTKPRRSVVVSEG
jgi:hypothetical protein